MKDKKDIFDRIFSIKFLRFAQPFYTKYREQLLYLFFGALTTIISIVVFALFTKVIPCDELIANIISWILAVLFAFLTNRIWVFQTVTKNGFGKQLVSFYLGRVTTLLVEEIIFLVFVKWLLLDAMLIKVIAQVIIIVLNYVISKLFVFKKSAKGPFTDENS